MKNKLSLSFLLVMVSLLFLGMYREEGKDSNKIRKTNTNDVIDYIAINQILMYFGNSGIGSHNVISDGSGLYWPGGRNGTLTAIFTDGLIWGGRVGTEIRVGGATYRYGLQAGPIINGKPADPSDSKYRIYKIVKGWESMPAGPERDRIAKDYNEWPVEDGAPWVDLDGDKVYTAGVDQPQFIGDEVNWMVMNDMDPSRTTFLYGTQPMGLEVQLTVFGFNRTGPLGDMVFKKYKLINKGNNTLRDMIVGYWSDPDLGDANDDYCGCDTALSLGFIYNGDNNDAGYYGAAPPAAGYDFFQGPVIPYDPVKYPIINEKNLPDSAKFDGRWIKGKTNLPLTSFSFYINSSTVYVDPTLGSPDGAIQMYNYMTSKLWDGTPFIDPNTVQPVKFCLAGDPITKKGWYEGAGWPGGEDPGDRRIAMSSGPFTMAPGDTQEVVVGILVARGGDNIGSLKALKDVDFAAQTAYDLDFKLTSPPPAPKLHIKPQDGKLTLYWEDNAESYIAEDPLIKGQYGVKDWTYDFEGYEVYQYRDEAGTDPVLLATYDKIGGKVVGDTVTKVLDWTTVQGENVLLPVVSGSESGLYRTMDVTSDIYSQEPLHNGTPYYFGIVAYAYNGESAPRVLKNTHVPVMARPETPSIDEEFIFNTGDYLEVTASERTDALVKPLVIDPDQLTGDNYTVTFRKVNGNPVWTLINLTSGDTLLKDQTTIVTLAELKAENLKAQILRDQKVNQGFVVAVANPGSGGGIKEVVMVKDGGTEVKPSGTIANFIPREGVNVFGKSSSRGWWIASIEAGGTSNQAQLWNKAVAAEDDFELRFTDQGSEYYAAENSLTKSTFKANPLAKNKVPFEFWNLKDKANSNDDARLVIKINEGWKNNKWPSFVETKDSIFNGSFIDISRLDKDSVMWNELHFWAVPDGYPSTFANPSPTSTTAQYPITKLQFMTKSMDSNDFPKPGTVIRISTWKPLKESTTFTFTATKPLKNNVALAKENIDKISVFPNPYFGSSELERDKYQRFMRFTNLPQRATIRIYSLAGVYISSIEKDGGSQYVDWNLRNSEGLPVASGIYLAYIDLPGVGSKILKLAVIQEKQYIDRL